MVDVSDLKALIVVLISLELQCDQDKLRILYQNFISLPDFICESLGRVVDRCHAEVMLVVNKEEAHWNICCLVQRVDNLRAHHQSWVFSYLQLGDVDDLACLRLLGLFDESWWKNLWDGLNHVNDSVCLQSALVSNSVVGSRDKSYNIVAFFISLQVWINLVGLLEISDSFIISLKIF